MPNKKKMQKTMRNNVLSVINRMSSSEYFEFLQMTLTNKKAKSKLKKNTHLVQNLSSESGIKSIDCFDSHSKVPVYTNHKKASKSSVMLRSKRSSGLKFPTVEPEPLILKKSRNISTTSFHNYPPLDRYVNYPYETILNIKDLKPSNTILKNSNLSSINKKERKKNGELEKNSALSKKKCTTKSVLKPGFLEENSIERGIMNNPADDQKNKFKFTKTSLLNNMLNVRMHRPTGWTDNFESCEKDVFHKSTSCNLPPKMDGPKSWEEKCGDLKNAILKQIDEHILTNTPTSNQVKYENIVSPNSNTTSTKKDFQMNTTPYELQDNSTGFDEKNNPFKVIIKKIKDTDTNTSPIVSLLNTKIPDKNYNSLKSCLTKINQSRMSDTVLPPKKQNSLCLEKEFHPTTEISLKKKTTKGKNKQINTSTSFQEEKMLSDKLHVINKSNRKSMNVDPTSLPLRSCKLNEFTLTKEESKKRNKINKQNLKSGNISEKYVNRKPNKYLEHSVPEPSPSCSSTSNCSCDCSGGGNSRLFVKSSLSNYHKHEKKTKPDNGYSNPLRKTNKTLRKVSPNRGDTYKGKHLMHRHFPNLVSQYPKDVRKTFYSKKTNETADDHKSRIESWLKEVINYKDGFFSKKREKNFLANDFNSYKESDNSLSNDSGIIQSRQKRNQGILAEKENIKCKDKLSPSVSSGVESLSGKYTEPKGRITSRKSSDGWIPVIHSRGSHFAHSNISNIELLKEKQLKGKNNMKQTEGNGIERNVKDTSGSNILEDRVEGGYVLDRPASALKKRHKVTPKQDEILQKSHEFTKFKELKNPQLNSKKIQAIVQQNKARPHIQFQDPHHHTAKPKRKITTEDCAACFDPSLIKEFILKMKKEKKERRVWDSDEFLKRQVDESSNRDSIYLDNPESETINSIKLRYYNKTNDKQNLNNKVITVHRGGEDIPNLKQNIEFPCEKNDAGLKKYKLKDVKYSSTTYKSTENFNNNKRDETGLSRKGPMDINNTDYLNTFKRESFDKSTATDFRDLFNIRADLLPTIKDLNCKEKENKMTAKKLTQTSDFIGKVDKSCGTSNAVQLTNDIFKDSFQHENKNDVFSKNVEKDTVTISKLIYNDDSIVHLYPTDKPNQGHNIIEENNLFSQNDITNIPNNIIDVEEPVKHFDATKNIVHLNANPQTKSSVTQNKDSVSHNNTVLLKKMSISEGNDQSNVTRNENVKKSSINSEVNKTPFNDDLVGNKILTNKTEQVNYPNQLNPEKINKSLSEFATRRFSHKDVPDSFRRNIQSPRFSYFNPLENVSVHNRLKGPYKIKYYDYTDDLMLAPSPLKSREENKVKTLGENVFLPKDAKCDMQDKQLEHYQIPSLPINKSSPKECSPLKDNSNYFQTSSKNNNFSRDKYSPVPDDYLENNYLRHEKIMSISSNKKKEIPFPPVLASGGSKFNASNALSSKDIASVQNKSSVYQYNKEWSMPIKIKDAPQVQNNHIPVSPYKSFEQHWPPSNKRNHKSRDSSLSTQSLKCERKKSAKNRFDGGFKIMQREDYYGSCTTSDGSSSSKTSDGSSSSNSTISELEEYVHSKKNPFRALVTKMFAGTKKGNSNKQDDLRSYYKKNALRKQSNSDTLKMKIESHSKSGEKLSNLGNHYKKVDLRNEDHSYLQNHYKSPRKSMLFSSLHKKE